MTLGRDDLVLCAGSMSARPLLEQIDAAAAAGFRGLSIYATDWSRALEDGATPGEVRRRLRDAGLAVAELDPLMSWLPDAGLDAAATDEGSAFFEASEEDFYRLNEALGGARSINAVLMTPAAADTALVTDAFAGLCERAAAHDLLVHLEFLPWTPIGDGPAAQRIVEGAGRENGGLMIDTWHWQRAGADLDWLAALDERAVMAVQVNDAPAEAEADLVEETIHRRRLPGEGDIDLRGFVRALDAIGCEAPIGVEVFSDDLAGLPVRDAAQRCADAARAVLADARSG